MRGAFDHIAREAAQKLQLARRKFAAHADQQRQELQRACRDLAAHCTAMIGLSSTRRRLSGLLSMTTAIPQRGSLSHGVTVKRSPAGQPISSLHINNQILRRRDPATVLHAAALAMRHAQTVAANTLAAVNHVATKQQTGGAAPAVHGVGATLRRPPSPRHVPPASLAQLKQQATDLQKSASKLSSVASKFKTQVSQARTRQNAAVSHQKSVTRLHGLIGLDANGLSPGMPGYDPTTDPTAGGADDPNGGGALPPSTPSTVSPVAGPPDYGAGPTPTPDTVAPQPGIDYVASSALGPSDWAQFYTSDPSGVLPNGSLGTPVPLGAIYFDGSRPLAFRAVGNATCFYGTLPGGAMPKGGPGSGYEWHGSGGFDWALVLQGSGGGYDGGKNYDKVNNPDLAMISESQKNGWGPLVGNPQLPEMDGLRLDVAKMAFFWPYDMAPSWAQAPVRQAAFNAAVVAWKAAQTAGQADYVAAQLQDKLDAQTAADNARKQAQQDLQLAQQQQVFDQQQQQAQAALDLQSQQDDEAMSVQQAQLDIAQQQADLYDDGGGGGGYPLAPGVSPMTTYDGGGAFVDQGGDPFGLDDSSDGDVLVGADGAVIEIDAFGNLVD